MSDSSKNVTTLAKEREREKLFGIIYVIDQTTCTMSVDIHSDSTLTWVGKPDVCAAFPSLDVFSTQGEPRYLRKEWAVTSSARSPDVGNQ